MSNTAKELSIAMLGMIAGNGHPYSWSAIINGYDPVEMKKCPYPVIAEYLGRQPIESVRIPGARVTHIWTDNPSDAPRVAAASKIEHVVNAPEDVIGHVDAVIIATDDGNDHVRRARPFIEAGLPVFVDKPLAINLADLKQFIRWQDAGARVLSTSGMRYMPELGQVRECQREIGDVRWITNFTCKSWERYGIHALEPVHALLGPGFLSAQTAEAPSAAPQIRDGVELGPRGSDIVHLTHRSGTQVTLAAIQDAYGSFGAMQVYGTKGHLPLSLRDTYTAFRLQLLAFIEFVRTQCAPVPFSQTVELMAAIIAAIRSRQEHGRVVPVHEILMNLKQQQSR